MIPEDADSQLLLALGFINDWHDEKEQFTFFTSGSTGKPKEIKASRKQIIASASATIQFLHLTSTPQHILICLNMASVGASVMLARALLLRADIILSQATANPFLDFDTHKKITFASFVPLQVESILKDKKSKKIFEQIENILIGGSSVSAKLEQELSDFDNSIWHSYGMTETLSHVALRRIGKEKYFKTMPSIELKLNAHNCLLIKGEISNNEWIETNDIADIHSDGTFEILGRTDFIINSGAYKINPEKIESAIEKLSLIDHPYFVGAIPDAVYTDIAVLVVECSDANHKNRLLGNFEASKYQLNQYLHKYEIPKKILFIEKIYYTHSQKIDRVKSNQALINQHV